MVLIKVIESLRKKIEFYSSQKQYEKAMALNDACIEILLVAIEELENKTDDITNGMDVWKKYMKTKHPEIISDYKFINEVNKNV